MTNNEDMGEWDLMSFGCVVAIGCCATLHKACKRGHVDCIRSFVEHGANIEEQDDDYHCNMTPLLTASFYGQLDAMSLLIQYGANMYARDITGETSLHLVCERGHIQCAYLLIKRGININLKNRDGKTPLHISCNRGHLNCIRLLLKHGADINDRALIWQPTKFEGETPLHVAVYSRNLECVRYLIEQGADLNSKLTRGDTPLHYAVYFKSIDIAELLLSTGADPTVVDCKNRTPKDIAIRYHNKCWAGTVNDDLSARFQSLFTSYEELPVKEPDIN